MPTLFAYNALLVVSDGVQARIGTLTAGKEWFKPWRTISGAALAESSLPELHVLIAGVLDRRRNDLDDQLFGTFALCKDLLRQPPVQAESRADLREKLRVATGGVVFTTIQKFMPEEKGDRHPLLSDRRNLVVIADEAHRSQYDFIDGFALHLPRAAQDLCR